MKFTFPKLKIGESGEYRGNTVRRLSRVFYASSHNLRLTYKRKELECILDPTPIGSKARQVNNPL